MTLQALQGRYYKSDIYSLRATLHQLVTGYLPSENEDEIDMFVIIERDNYSLYGRDGLECEPHMGDCGWDIEEDEESNDDDGKDSNGEEGNEGTNEDEKDNDGKNGDHGIDKNGKNSDADESKKNDDGDDEV